MLNKIECLEDVSNFTIKLGGKNSVDAEGFNQIIKNTVFLMQKSAALTVPDSFLRVEIKGNSQGSFLISLAIIIKNNNPLITFGKDVLGMGASVFGIYYAWLKIKQHLIRRKRKKL